jgi:hypothetical protein
LRARVGHPRYLKVLIWYLNGALTRYLAGTASAKVVETDIGEHIFAVAGPGQGCSRGSRPRQAEGLRGVFADRPLA